MRTVRYWIVIAPLLALPFLAPGCGKKKDPKTVPTSVPLPQESTTVSRPTTDVDASGRIGTESDAREALPEPSIAELQSQLEGGGLLGDIFYDFDSYGLKSDARERLARNAEFMSSGEGRGLTFNIEGHCDERGTNEYNLALGESRSTAALDYLASLGVERSRFRVVSFGEERPFCTESSEACWQRNRRARFVITGRQ